MLGALFNQTLKITEVTCWGALIGNLLGGPDKGLEKAMSSVKEFTFFVEFINRVINNFISE